MATSAVTLLIAAGITLSPLQSQLRDQSIDQLQTATQDAAQRLHRRAHARASKEDRRREAAEKDDEPASRPAARAGRRTSALVDPAYELRNRIPGARVLGTDGTFTNTSNEAPAFLFDTD